MVKSDTLEKLFFLMTSVDGQVKPKEEAAAATMCTIEGIDRETFTRNVRELNVEDHQAILASAVHELRSMTHIDQVRCVAWLCLVANADGFMEKTEWQFIYTIYHKELNLPLEDVMNEQKRLYHSSRHLELTPA